MKNKTLLTVINIFIGLSIFLASLNVNSTVFAQAQNERIIPFSELGVVDIVLNGPYDSKGLSFSLPDNWELVNGTLIELYIEVFITSDKVSQSGDYVGGNLNVYFNRKLQQTISLVDDEERVYRVPIRAEDLNVVGSDGRVQISFFLDAGIDCDYVFHKTTVKISSASALDVIYSEIAPSLDLRDLPRPIYKRDSYLPELAKVVIPDKASVDELKAAYLVMAALGRMTNRQLDLELITNRQLTQSVREEAHLIFVGKAASLPLLSQLQLPVPVAGGKFDSQVLQSDDGLLQMTISPWNPSKVILVVGGNNDAGVVKAGQTLTTGNIQTGSLPTVSFIAQVAPLEVSETQEDNSNPISSLDYTLAELGYSVEQVGVGTQSVGIQYFTYEFNNPVDQIAEEQTYFDLIFSYSSLIDPARSEISVYVNGVLAGSVRFSDEKTSFVKERIELPPVLILPGINRIEFAAELIPYNVCTTVNLNGLWMSIYPESSIHIQFAGGVIEQSQFMELRNYPYPFLADPSMSDLTVVLSETDSDSWVAFGELIYSLSGQATGEVISFEVGFNGNLSEDERQNNLILFGVPTELVLEDELNAVLPAPFEKNSNVATLDNQTVVYRIEPNKSLGYLELLPSPWTEEKTILAVLGTNLEGLSFSVQALLDSKIRTGLKGNFATIDGDQFTVVDTRSGLGLGTFQAAVGTEVVEEIASPPVVDIEQANVPTYDFTRQIILIVFAFVVVAILVMIVIVFVSRKKKTPKN